MTRSLVLVHPPQPGLMEGFANGLISLANFVSHRAPELNVELLDLSRCDQAQARQQLRDALRASDAHTLLGISTTTASYQSALAVARAAKCISKDVFVVLGGHHASPEADVVLAHHADVDAVMTGEGERGLLALSLCFPDRLSSVPNLVYRSRLGVHRNPQAELLDESVLDSIGPVFRDSIGHASAGKFDRMTYVSARGCPLRCAFCAVANERIRAKSPSRVVDDLTTLVLKHGRCDIAIEDNFFAHSLRRTLDLCGALETMRQSVDFRWDCQTRVESLARAGVIPAMASAGCDAVYVGVEALDADTLSYLGKTTTPDRYLATLVDVVVPRLLQSPLQCHINLQYGVTGDTPARRASRRRLLTRLGAAAASAGKEITIFPQLAVTYPGTAHFATAVRDKRFGPHTREIFEDFTYWEARRQPVLDWMGETFAHGTGGVPEGILNEHELRHGRFVVDGESVLRVLDELRDVEHTRGLRLFKYGRYLAGPRKAITDAQPR